MPTLYLGIHASATPMVTISFLRLALNRLNTGLSAPAAFHLQTARTAESSPRARVGRASLLSKHGIHALLRPADRAVHPFQGHQHRAEHITFASQAWQAG